MSPSLKPNQQINVPVGLALPSKDLTPVRPRTFAERNLKNIQRWTVLPRGGHFVAMEFPKPLAEDMRAYFRPQHAKRRICGMGLRAQACRAESLCATSAGERMTPIDIAHQRLFSQQIAQPTFAQPSEVVAWLGAVQAQDYLGALWAVGLRISGATEQTIEQALAEKTIVRTWPMRGTIHFVAATDVRWMLELLAPRVIRRSKSRHTQLGLDETVISASAKVITKALHGGKQLPRNALYALLEREHIATDSSRGLHILGRLAHDRLICFGARAGKQPTFALLDEWVPDAKSLPHDQALAMLALRYFTGHGPATVQDLMWWSGLTTTEAKAGLAAVATQLGRQVIAGQEYYFAQERTKATRRSLDAFLLPPFDEFLVSYRDRRASLDADYNTRVVPGGNGIFNPIIVIDGRVVGTWKRTLKKASVELTFSPFTAFSDAQANAITAAAERYGRFVGKRAIVTI